MKFKHVAAATLLALGAASAQALSESRVLPPDRDALGEPPGLSATERQVADHSVALSTNHRISFEEMAADEFGLLSGWTGSNLARPVAESHTSAMLLVGLGLMVAVALRRRSP